MKSKAQLRALALVVIGLLGMGAYQILLRLEHPTMMERDFFRGIWFGACFGFEIIGLYLLFKDKGKGGSVA